MDLLNKIKNILLGLIVPLILIVSWEIATRLKLFPPQLLVPPEQVIFTFLDLLKKGDLIVHLKISLIRVIAGFTTGTLAGFILGTAMGLSKNVERYIAPSFHSIRQVPLFAWMPLLMLWLGIGEVFKVVFIAIGSFYPMTLNTFEGIRGVPKEYVEVAKVFEYSRFKLLRKVIFPAALPNILTGIRIGIGMSWMFVVGAEIIASSEGIGYLMNWGRQLFQFDIVMVGFFVIGIIGLIMNNAVRPVETYFLRWQKTFKR
jgi:sulfonate transport system permease protein